MINDQAPSLPAVCDRTPSATASDAGRVVLGLLVPAFAGVTGLVAPRLVLASDDCFEGDNRAICSAGGRHAGEKRAACRRLRACWSCPGWCRSPPRAA